jgi:predicted HicB family RNase H-like nuclease
MKTIEKKNTVSLAASTYALAVKMAKAEGITTDAWLGELVRSKTTARKAAPPVTEESDGSITLNTKYSREVRIAAARTGETVEQWVNRALSDYADILLAK